MGFQGVIISPLFHCYRDGERERVSYIVQHLVTAWLVCVEVTEVDIDLIELILNLPYLDKKQILN